MAPDAQHDPEATARPSEAPIAAPSLTDEPDLIAVFGTHTGAERAVRALSRSGFDMTRLSLIEEGYHREDRPLGFYTTGTRLKAWAVRGALLGAALGLLVRPGFFLLPLLGRLVILGPLLSAVMAALDGAVTLAALSLVLAAIYSLAVSRDAAIRYGSIVRPDRFLLVAHGLPEERAQAGRILRTDKLDRM